MYNRVYKSNSLESKKKRFGIWSCSRKSTAASEVKRLHTVHIQFTDVALSLYRYNSQSLMSKLY